MKVNCTGEIKMDISKIYKKNIALILCILLILAVLGFKKYDNMKNPHQAFEKDLKQQENSIENRESDSIDGRVASEKSIINLLLLGVDSTEARETMEMGYRSDAIMVASMNLDTKKVKLISIPRDSYTDVPGINRKDKINHAMAFGGGPREKGNEYAVRAVEDLLGVDIHYYATMDLDAVKDIVDRIGGVTVDVERSMNHDRGRLEKGIQLLNGEQALIYLSNRNAPTGDFARIEQQQKFMMALFQEVKEKGRLSDILPLYLKVQNKIFTNLNIEQIGALVVFLMELRLDDIETFTLRGSHMFLDDIYYLDLDREYLEEIVQGIYN